MKPVVSCKQKLGIRLLAIAHDINKLSAQFVRSKSINNPVPDVHAEEIRASLLNPQPFWRSTALLPAYYFDLPSAAPLWYLCWKHHVRDDDLLLHAFQRAETYTAAMSFYTVPYGRKQTDRFIAFKDMLWTPLALGKLRAHIEALLPTIDEPPSQEEACRHFHELEHVLSLLQSVPADTRELSPSYTEHVLSLERYFAGSTQPIRAISYQTYRTLLLMGYDRHHMLERFSNYVSQLLPWYQAFLERQIQKVETHYNNTKSRETMQRLALLNEELLFLKELGVSKQPGDPDALFKFMCQFYWDPKPSSLYTKAGSVLASLRLHSSMDDVMAENGFLIRAETITLSGPVKRICAKGLFQLTVGEDEIRLPLRYIVLASAIVEDEPKPYDLCYQGQVLRPLCRLKPGEQVTVCLPRTWLL